MLSHHHHQQESSSTDSELADVLIIGGGPAGLTAATTLARQLRSVVLFDSGDYRNGASNQMHMLPGYEHKDAKEFRRAARHDLLHNYHTVKVEEVEVRKAEKRGDALFELQDKEGRTWMGRKLILATGSVDVFPHLEGYDECWTTGIFHNLYYLGYEERGASSAGILAIGSCAIPAIAIHLAELALTYASSVTVYCNGHLALAKELAPILESEQTSPSSSSTSPSRFIVDARPIRRIVKTPHKAQVTLEFGGISVEADIKTEDFLVHVPLTTARGPFAAQLGLQMTPTRDIFLEGAAGQTSVRGVFAAGDLVAQQKAVPGAVGSGCNAAVGVNAQLAAERYGHGHAGLV